MRGSMKNVEIIEIKGRPTAETVRLYKKEEEKRLSSPPPRPSVDAKEPVYEPNVGSSFWDKIERPHCPNCGYRLTHWSHAVNDEVYEHVNECPRCRQSLLWDK